MLLIVVCGLALCVVDLMCVVVVWCRWCCCLSLLLRVAISFAAVCRGSLFVVC